MEPVFFDSHAHLDDPRFDQDRSETVDRAYGAGVKKIVNVGFDLASCRRAVLLAERYPGVFAAVGIHPHDAKDWNPVLEEELRLLAAHPKVVALGEMGLDYYRNLSPREAQHEVFRNQLEMAVELDLPVIIHDREAHGDVMAILQEYKGRVAGILHCFSGSVEMAEECLKLGYYISIAGPVTFNNARKTQEVAAAVPLDKLLIETDAPYLTPEPYRGKRNEPAHVVKVAEKIASLRGITVEEVARETFKNTERVFRLQS